MPDFSELKKGDFIDSRKLYEVRGLIGRGGFGAVYLIYSINTQTLYAYKTLLPELARDRATAERFRKEANIWVDLGQHPNLVNAVGVTEQMGRFFICMEYIKPDKEGVNSLDGHLRNGPIDFPQCLKWAIEFCYGMEFAYSKGIQCHRDIKPANIMIDGTTAKVSDFGIARVVDEKSKAELYSRESLAAPYQHGQTAVGTAFGTPFYMSPEQLIDATSCDQRSDIYSFGVVLYQMRAHGNLPFVPPLQRHFGHREFWQSIFKMHCECPPPRLNSRIGFIIQRCLAKHPDDRYQSFQELRSDLESVLKSETGESLPKPQPQAEELNLKGRNLQALGRHSEAIECFDKELRADGKNPAAWYNKGKSLHALGRHAEAVKCFYRSAEHDFYLTWALEANANLLTEMKRFEEAISCYDKMLSFQRPNHSVSDSLKVSWYFNRGNLLVRLGSHQKAIESYEKSLNPAFKYIKPEAFLLSWLNKGCAEATLHRRSDATVSFQRFLAVAEPEFAQKYAKHIQEAKRFLAAD